SGAAFTPFLTVPGGADVGISLLSASKAFNLAGLKCAAVVTSSDRMRAVTRRLPPDGRWRVGHFGVLATVAALTDGDEWLAALVATLDCRREQLGALVREQLPAVAWSPPEATFLAWLDCRVIGSGAGPRDLFLAKGRVALEPGTSFGTPGNGWVRLNFGTSAVILSEAVARMAQALP
ncbi:MAG: aminotransferase class I/II-fold pyridoxal phosphate-dependent enzyme, partial [Actinomycetota bacterium]|nr:aminotransferase class I/II-fold pyridoxal phosphate-dependent enzyme [Actinomycetota bacterium]